MTTHRSNDLFGSVLVVELTDIWTPPCSSIVQFEYYSTESCAPPQYTSVWYDYGYYSPAICPSGYTSGCTPTTEIDPGQTAAVCVPRGWKCSSDFILHAWTTEGSNTISAPAFQIRWEESDLPNLETHPLTPAAQETGPPSSRTSGPIPTPTDFPNPDGGDDTGGGGDIDGSGMSSGAVAGIAVGVAVVVAIIFLGLFLWYRRKHLPKTGGVEQAGGEKGETLAAQPPTANGPGAVSPSAPIPNGPQKMDAKDAAKSGAVMGVLGGLTLGGDGSKPASPTPGVQTQQVQGQTPGSAVPANGGVHQLDGPAVPGATVAAGAQIQQLDGQAVHASPVPIQPTPPPAYGYPQQLHGTPIAGPQPVMYAPGTGPMQQQYVYAQQLDGRPVYVRAPEPAEMYTPVHAVQPMQDVQDVQVTQAGQMPPELSATNQEFINQHQHPSELEGNVYYAQQPVVTQQPVMAQQPVVAQQPVSAQTNATPGGQQPQ